MPGVLLTVLVVGLLGVLVGLHRSPRVRDARVPLPPQLLRWPETVPQKMPYLRNITRRLAGPPRGRG